MFLKWGFLKTLYFCFWSCLLARTRRYKRAEKNAVQTILHFFGRIGVGIGRGFSSFFHGCNHKLTIMIVPHSKSKVLNFQTTVFSLISCAIIIAGVLFSFFWFNKTTFSANVEIARLQTENKEARAGLDELRDENTNLLQAAKKFQGSLSETLSMLGMNQQTKKKHQVKHKSGTSLRFLIFKNILGQQLPKLQILEC